MNRRNLVGVLGAAASGLAVTGIGEAAEFADEKHHEHGHMMAKKMAECMLECSSCMRHCIKMLAEGKKDHARCAEICNDCMHICECGAHCAQGPLAAIVMKSCAEACDVCAAECEKFPDDEVCKACAKVCRDCAKACRA